MCASSAADTLGCSCGVSRATMYQTKPTTSPIAAEK
jgi:hypothetical protein